MKIPEFKIKELCPQILAVQVCAFDKNLALKCILIYPDGSVEVSK